MKQAAEWTVHAVPSTLEVHLHCECKELSYAAEAIISLEPLPLHMCQSQESSGDNVLGAAQLLLLDTLKCHVLSRVPGAPQACLLLKGCTHQIGTGEWSLLPLAARLSTKM